MPTPSERFRALTTRQMVAFERRAAAARSAIGRRAAAFEAKVNWFGEKIERDVKIGMAQRVKLAGTLLKEKVQINISRPVHKLRVRRIRGTGTYTWVDPRSRSKPGEFPKLETGQLRRLIFNTFDRSTTTTRVGTTLGYGVILETRLNRSFLRRTLREERDMLIRVLVKGKGGGAEPKVFA